MCCPTSTDCQFQFNSVSQSCPTPWDPMNRSTPGLPVHHQLLESTQMSIESVMPSNHLILCRPLLLLPSIFPSIRVFANESALRIRWSKYWSFSFSISPSNEHPGLISFRIDWLDFLAVPGTLKSLLQYHSLGITKFIIWEISTQFSAFLTFYLSWLAFLLIWAQPHFTLRACIKATVEMTVIPFPDQSRLED